MSIFLRVWHSHTENIAVVKATITGHFERDMKSVFSILFYKYVWRITLILLVLIAFATSRSANAGAVGVFSAPNSCVRVPAAVASEHLDTQQDVTTAILQDFSDHREFLTTTFAQENVIPALQLFAETNDGCCHAPDYGDRHLF